MKPTAKRKLNLSTETVRALSSQELAQVDGGGFTDISTSCSCNSCICSVLSDCGPGIVPGTGSGRRTGSGSGSGW